MTTNRALFPIEGTTVSVSQSLSGAKAAMHVAVAMALGLSAANALPGQGTRLHVDRRPAAARIGQPLGVLRGTVDSDGGNPVGELSLELPGFDSLYTIVDPSITIGASNRSFTTRSLVIVPKTRVAAYDVT